MVSFMVLVWVALTTSVLSKQPVCANKMHVSKLDVVI